MWYFLLFTPTKPEFVLRSDEYETRCIYDIENWDEDWLLFRIPITHRDEERGYH